MNSDVYKVRLGELRKMLIALDKTVDYQEPGLLRQAAQVDMEKMEKSVEYLIDRVTCLAHAFDVMKSGKHAHPMSAILHSLQCMWPDVTDEEFMYIVNAWSRLVGPAAFAQSTIYVPDGNSAGAFEINPKAAE